eukprot:1772345-Lingulodinium_polyedra.AAC.1
MRRRNCSANLAPRGPAARSASCSMDASAGPAGNGLAYRPPGSGGVVCTRSVGSAQSQRTAP